MALYVLESCVAWDKSIMKAVRSVVGSFLEDGVRVCVYNVLSTTRKVHKSLGLCVFWCDVCVPLVFCGVCLPVNTFLCTLC